MKRQLHKYLSRTYFVKGCEIHHIIDGRIRSAFLIKDLIKVFGLSKPKLKWVVKSWVKKQNKGFDFNEYWTPKSRFSVSFFQNFLPRIQHVAARSIASDLVAVTPMNDPRMVSYLNSSYNLENEIAEYENIRNERYRLVEEEQRLSHFYNQPIGEQLYQPSRTFLMPNGGW